MPAQSASTPTKSKLKEPRRLVSKPDSGFIYELGVRGRLLWRLLRDERVSPLYKLLPIGSFLYLLNPFDVIGPVDDAFVIWLGSTLFIELAPPDIVQEHRAALESVRKAESANEQRIEDKDIIDADFSE